MKQNDIEITFGICVGPVYDKNMLEKLISSIIKQSVPVYEILMIGENLEHYEYMSDKIRTIYFDESVKAGWITRKKNILAQEARYDNLCIMHDCYLLHDGWYEGVLKCPSDWNILMNEMLTLEGTRNVAWNVSPIFMQRLINVNPEKFIPMLMKVAPHENGPQFVNGLPYDVDDLSHIQYIGGGFVFCKKDVLLKVPMNEEMVYGQPEDVDWSLKLSNAGYTYRYNPYSQSSTQKPKKWHVFQMPDEFVIELRSYYGSKK